MTIGQETRGSIPHVELKICPEGKDAIPRVESTTTLFCDLNTRQPNNAAACINGRLSRCGTALSFALTQQCPSCERTQQDIDVSTLGSNRTSEAVQKLVICWFGQRRVVVVGGRGGSEDQSWKHQTCLLSALFACVEQGLYRQSQVTAKAETCLGKTRVQWLFRKVCDPIVEHA